MKVPKYINEALSKRAYHASKLMDYDRIVSDFIEKHKIDVDSEDYLLGVEIIGDPYGSSDRVREAIINKE